VSLKSRRFEKGGALYIIMSLMKCASGDFVSKQCYIF